MLKDGKLIIERKIDSIIDDSLEIEVPTIRVFEAGVTKHLWFIKANGQSIRFTMVGHDYFSYHKGNVYGHDIYELELSRVVDQMEAYEIVQTFKHRMSLIEFDAIVENCNLNVENL